MDLSRHISMLINGFITGITQQIISLPEPVGQSGTRARIAKFIVAQSLLVRTRAAPKLIVIALDDY
jgi:hypothetical protein